LDIRSSFVILQYQFCVVRNLNRELNAIAAFVLGERCGPCWKWRFFFNLAHANSPAAFVCIAGNNEHLTFSGFEVINAWITVYADFFPDSAFAFKKVITGTVKFKFYHI
ncbi:hypothetical protein, partial [Klebsiella grimontii]|uniref:hypothetical protein n=1 Tax=Klebsiella grimontii TaxID=2058152 RepID=UPI001C49AAE1